MPSRRPHTKNRHGCMQCKASHMKCDQGLPSCGLCQRKGKNCNYGIQEKHLSRKSSPILLTPTSLSISKERNLEHREDSNQLSSFSRSSPIPPDIETCYSISWEDLELMRHFVTNTYATFSCIPSIQDLWQNAIPKMASDYPFTMHSILSISALHLAFLNPTKRSLYFASAIRHHDLSLPVYRSQLHNITPVNSSAVFVCSVLISLCILAIPICGNSSQLTSSDSDHCQQKELEDPIRLVTSIVSLLQGSSTIIHDSWSWLESGPISALFLNRYKTLKIESDAQGDFSSSHSALQLLMTRIDSLSSPRYTSSLLSFEEHNAYNNAISTLQKLFALMTSIDTDNGAVLIWPFLLERKWGFASLLKEMRPLALVVLAHYGVALHAFRGDWYIGDWGRRLVLNVERTLALLGKEDEQIEWGEMIAWPLERVNNGE